MTTASYAGRRSDGDPAAPGRPLTIGIDARAATEVGAGRGRVVRELLRALSEREDAHMYVCYARTRWEAPLGDRMRWAVIPERDPVWNVHAARAASHHCDVFLSTNSYVTVPFLSVPAVTIVYDLVTFEPSMRPNRRSLVIERLTLGSAVRRSAGLVAISQATADALIGRFPAAAERTTVALLGVSPALHAGAPEGDDLPTAGFVLAVGTLEPRKNLPRLVAAYTALSSELQRDHPLVVVGASGWENRATELALRSLGERCIRLGRVSDATLGELYRRCGAFCYPSLGEGFGLPVLEAMQAGAPVITSALSSLPEVGGKAVRYVDPFSVTSIRDGLEQVLSDSDLRTLLSEAGRVRAADFSWSHFAEGIVAALELAARSGRR